MHRNIISSSASLVVVLIGTSSQAHTQHPQNAKVIPPGAGRGEKRKTAAAGPSSVPDAGKLLSS